MLGFSSTHRTSAFSGGFIYRPTMSSNLASKSGSGLKVKVRTRCSGSFDVCRMVWTVLGGNRNFRANVRTVQRPCDSGCWQAKVCTFCQTPASCLGGLPERGASRSPSSPRATNDRRHLPTVTSGICRPTAICWFDKPAAACNTMRLRRTWACGVEEA